jgi:alkylhydroperoxidase family enzyme
VTEPHLPLLTVDEALTRADDAGIPDQLGVLNVFRMLLHRPPVAKATSDLLLSMLFGGALDDRLRELAIMRIGWSTGSDYEWTQHWTVAQDPFGVSADDLLALRDWEASDVFGDVERAVLAATDEALATGTASPATIATCRDLLGSDDAVLELVASIATWRWISQVARSLDIPLEDGVASWPPDGQASPNHTV